MLTRRTSFEGHPPARRSISTPLLGRPARSTMLDGMMDSENARSESPPSASDSVQPGTGLGDLDLAATDCDGATEWVAATVSEAGLALHRQGVGSELSQLLGRRGVTTAAEVDAFLRPALDQLHPPLDLSGVREAVSRLMVSAERGERVAVVGDYDADGVSGTAVLTACLRLAGIDALPILPNRLVDGYGFQLAQVEKANSAGCRLIVTVDCGMGSSVAAGAALDAGMEVIVTDHHLPSDELPDVVALVNPRLETGAGTYPNPDLCGAGIAFKLGVALLEAAGKRPPLQSLLRVACLGTIADLVPLRGENRCIAALGLAALGSARSPGLKELMKVAGVKPPVKASDVGFRLGPRLNAAGRLSTPDHALELLLTRDAERARTLAEELDQFNKERQKEEAHVVTEARDSFRELEVLPRILVAWQATWHRGVVGIAASRIAREFNRPTLLLGVEGEEAVGSGRSIAGIHLHEFLSPWRHRLLRFGGHSQAIGLSVAVADLPRLVDEWNTSAEGWAPEVLRRSYPYELMSDDLNDVRDRLYPLLESFEPHGQGNPAPLLRLGPLRAALPPRQFATDSLDIMVEDIRGGRMRLTAWRCAPRLIEFDGRFEVLARLGWDDYLGAPALTLVDVRSF